MFSKAFPILLASLFLVSDLTSQFIIFCGKDFSFSLSVLILSYFCLGYKGSDRYLRVLLIVLLSSFVSFFGCDYLPDTWLVTQSDKSYSIEYAWIIALIPMVAFLLYSKKVKSVFLLAVIASLLLSGLSERLISIDHKRPFGNKDSLVVESVMINKSETGQLDDDWVARSTDYALFIEAKNRLKSSKESWLAPYFRGSDSSKYLFEITKIHDGFNISVIEISKDRKLGLLGVIAYLMIWISLLLSIFTLFKGERVFR